VHAPGSVSGACKSKVLPHAARRARSGRLGIRCSTSYTKDGKEEAGGKGREPGAGEEVPAGDANDASPKAASWLNSWTVPKSVWQWLAKLATAPQGIDWAQQPAEVRKSAARLPDEVHYVRVPNTDWEIALWRYLPRAVDSRGGCGEDGADASARATPRQHSVLLVPGCASNAQSFDLAPKASLSRHLAEAGYDTWVVEMRGIGLSRHTAPAPKLFAWKDKDAGSQLGSEGAAYATWKRWALEKMVWDMDTYVNEDLPVAIDYIKQVSRPPSNKVVGIGHSMGGMILYALCGVTARRHPETPPLCGVVTLASALRLSSTEPEQEEDSAAQLIPLAAEMSSPAVDAASDRARLAEDGGAPAGAEATSSVALRLPPPRLNTLPSATALRASQYATIARYGANLPELTHVLPVPVDLVSQLQSAMALPWMWIVEHQLEEWWAWVQVRARLNRTGGADAATVEDEAGAGAEPVGRRVDDKDTLEQTPAQNQASPFGALLTKTNLQGRVWFPKQAPSVEANKPATLDDETSVVAPTTNKAEGTRRRAVKSYVNRAMRAGASSTTTALQGAMPSPLLRRLLCNGFETVPLALLIQMTTLFTEGGLQSRATRVSVASERVNYIDQLKDIQVPVLAIAGGADPVIPPNSVRETVDMVSNGEYLCCGNCWTGEVPLDQVSADEDYFSHYDVLAGTKAKVEVYAAVCEFLEDLERTEVSDPRGTQYTS